MIDGTTAATVDLGPRDDVGAILEVLGDMSGWAVADVGCGEGGNARELAARGALVSGFDPFIEPQGWVAQGDGRFRLVCAAANELPLEDASVDVVLFVFSLHHVPKDHLGAALTEARRVLKPAGRLLVAEPLAQGPSHYVGSLFHDETVVRAGAAAALNVHVAPHAGRRDVFAYTEQRRWDNFERYSARMIRNRRFNGYTVEAVLAPTVRERFDEMFAAHGGAFDQPVRIDLFSEFVRS